MTFNKLKFLLLPFSWLYGFITWARNKLYDKGVLSTYRSPLHTIVIGNLQVGGSGKTPMTDYLYTLLRKDFHIAILSRGYGRKSSGLIEAHEGSDAGEIGDEPMWYHRNLKDVKVVVSESRKKGLQYLENTETELVLLDDAFQHRAITGDISIILSEYSRPYYRDYPMPYGRMREFRTGDKRADIIIMSKCPAEMTLQEKIDCIHRINPLDHQSVFFTSLISSDPVSLKGNKNLKEITYKRIFALSAIASPESFYKILRHYAPEIIEAGFKDHHYFTVSEIKSLLGKLDDDSIVFCTEKDAVKLQSEPLFKILPENKIFVLPVKPAFLFGESEKFNNQIKGMLYRKSKQVS